MYLHACYTSMDYNDVMEDQFVGLTPYENFLFALRVPETKRQYPHRLDKFMTFIGLEGTIPEKCNRLYEIGKNNPELLQSYIIRFIDAQKQRNEITKEIRKKIWFRFWKWNE